MARHWIGISGWNYPNWRKRFYPVGLPQKRELAYAGSCFNSVEINGSFYSLQKPDSYRRWRQETPEDFVFAVKGPRFITHMKKLRDVRLPLANFFASGPLALGAKLGPILWQFPPQLKFDEERFTYFLELLPKTTAQALELAREHDVRLAERCWLQAERDVPLRYAFELRHASFFSPAFASLLRAYGVALVLADTAGLWPYCEELTADFVYIRLHGAEQLYASGYTDTQLDWWAQRIRLWSVGREPPDVRRLRVGSGMAATPKVIPALRDATPAPRDVYVYFDNDAQVHAPFDAQRLARMLASHEH